MSKKCHICNDTGKTDGAAGFNGKGPCPYCSPKDDRDVSQEIQNIYTKLVNEKDGTPMNTAPVVNTDPVKEAIAKKLHGIDSVPISERSRMIRRAAKAGAEALRKLENHHD